MSEQQQQQQLYSMDKVERLLEQYGEDTNRPFGFHAWTASFFVEPEEMDRYVSDVEQYLRSRTDDSVEPKLDVDGYTMESPVHKHYFAAHVFHMAYSI